MTKDKYKYKDYRNFYSTIPKNDEGWVSLKEYNPSAFEIVSILLSSKRILKGWWTGQDWYIRRKQENENILAWKKTYTVR